MDTRKRITAKQVLELVQRQEFRCAISGRELTPETASIDHIVPLARGGEHAIANVWIVDHQVNTAKGTLALDEFITLCRDVVAHQDRVAECSRPGNGAGAEAAEQRGGGRDGD